MNKVGKIYPLMDGYDFWFFHEGYLPARYGIPRRWQMVNSGATSGTFAAKWMDDTFISEVYEVADDRQEILWRWIHPDEPDAIVRLKMTWEEFDDDQGDNSSNFRYVYRLQYLDVPGMLSNGILDRDPDPSQWHRTPANTTRKLVNVNWPGLVNATHFAKMGTLSAWAPATWEQQPEYHPYRYNPWA
jgi:hypothetical protein